jgi:hypothetical protein
MNRLVQKNHFIQSQKVRAGRITYSYMGNGNFIRNVLVTNDADDSSGLVYREFEKDSMVVDAQSRIIESHSIDDVPWGMVKTSTTYANGKSILGTFNFSKYLYVMPDQQALFYLNDWTISCNPLGHRQVTLFPNIEDFKYTYNYDGYGKLTYVKREYILNDFNTGDAYQEYYTYEFY